MISLLIAVRQERGSVLRCLFKVRPPRALHRDPRVPVSTDSEPQDHVPVYNWKRCRLDYRVAKTTGFYVKRIHTGGSFPPNTRASSMLVYPFAAPNDWLARIELSGAAVFKPLWVTRQPTECCPNDGRNESVKRRFLGPLFFAFQEG